MTSQYCNPEANIAYFPYCYINDVSYHNLVSMFHSARETGTDASAETTGA